MWEKVESLRATEDEAEAELSFADLRMLAMACTMAVCAVVLFIAGR